MLEEKMWANCNKVTLKPPIVRTLRGRPKKNIIRKEGEPNNLDRISKKGTKMKYANCGQYGHNPYLAKIFVT